MDSVSALKQELQRHLNHARAHIRLDLPEGLRFNVADRQTEIGMVQHIEEFTAELKFFRFRQPNVLERREVPVHISGAFHGIAALVPKLLDWRIRILGNSLKGAYIEPLSRSTRPRIRVAYYVGAITGES